MKKRVLWLLMLMLLTLYGCKQKQEENINYNYEIKSERVDMSSYQGVSSTNHNFRIIRVEELFNTIDNKSSGLFYFGRSNCGCCQNVTRYLNEVALDMNVTIYYIDAYNEAENLANDQEKQEQLFDYMYDILGENDQGEKTLLTPHLFQVINGELKDNQICYNGVTSHEELNENDVQRLKERYRKILTPFIKIKQD